MARSSKILKFASRAFLGESRPFLSFAVGMKPRANGRNIVGCYMLRPFAHPVACCCVLLGVVSQSLKPVTYAPTARNISFVQ